MGIETSALAASFDDAAKVYAAARPGYPADAVDWLVPSTAQDVLDLGAGTGKFTQALVRPGRVVTAVDPSPKMLAELAARLPEVRTVVGSAERIGVPDASADVVTVAQAWHWFDPGPASAQVARVLRPHGRLALVWNMRDESVGWVAGLTRILAKFGDDGAGRHGHVEHDPKAGPEFGSRQRYVTSWSQPMTLPGLLDLVASRSYAIVLPPKRRTMLLDAVADLVAADPDLRGRETFDLPYVTYCYAFERLEER